MSIVQKSDSFPPQQVKEKIGELSVSIARSTAPENKLALTRSRITTLLGIMKYKCREWTMPGLSTLLYDTIDKMLKDMIATGGSKVTEEMIWLESFLDKECKRSVEEKLKYYPLESLELLRDYNEVVACRDRWNEASDIYMKNHESWAISNKMIGDVNDILEELELNYNLSIMPKHYTYDINNLNLLNQPTEDRR